MSSPGFFRFFVTFRFSWKPLFSESEPSGSGCALRLSPELCASASLCVQTLPPLSRERRRNGRPITMRTNGMGIGFISVDPGDLLGFYCLFRSVQRYHVLRGCGGLALRVATTTSTIRSVQEGSQKKKKKKRRGKRRREGGTTRRNATHRFPIRAL